MNPLRAFCTFWLPSDGIRELIRQQAVAIEVEILDAELAERKAHFHVLRLRAQHRYLLGELKGQRVDNFPPVGDNASIPPGRTDPLANAYPYTWSHPHVPTPKG
jgi:hypothetical protein